MAAPPPRPPRRRPRRGSVERPVNARTYRGMWLLVGVPFLVAAFSVSRATPLPAPELPPTFDGAAARLVAGELARRYPERTPGTHADRRAARWVADRFRVYGLRPRIQRFRTDVPGLGPRTLTNVVAVVPGRSDATIVVIAHRDDAGGGQGANDNASGTGALIELARTYARAGAGRARVVPAHRVVFLSSDAGAFGGLGAVHFADDPAYGRGVLAVVVLDAIAGRGAPRLLLTGDDPRSPPPTLVQTAAARVLDETGEEPRHASPLAQLLDLGFPFSLFEQAPLLARGIPAVTLTTGPERPPSAASDSPALLVPRTLTRLGRAAQQLLVSLDQGPEEPVNTAPYLYFGPRLVPGWAVEIVLIGALVPFLAAAIDLFARCRRRRIPLAPALRSYRSRLLFWLLAGALFWLFRLAGAWPTGAARPLAPSIRAAHTWPLLSVGLFAAALSVIWLVSRDRLLPRRRVEPEEELAGYTGVLLVLGVLALLVVATNAFALVLLLPSLHAWLWLPQVHARAAWVRLAVLAAGLTGPLLLVWSFATRAGLGLDAPWYLATLAAVGYVGLPTIALFLAWMAAAGQLTALTARRYAPYPRAAERPPRGPLRELVRRIVLSRRDRRARSLERVRAVGP
jgi:hypothetical protein